jgi:uncharacterized protein (DUF2267 family)
MSATGLGVFDTTLSRTNAWLNDLMSVLGWQERQKAYLALRATLHALRDRLTVEEVAQFGAQLPMMIRHVLPADIRDLWPGGAVSAAIR